VGLVGDMNDCEVGLVDGEVEGDVVGLLDGEVEGDVVGKDVGEVVGDSVGTVVGESVGIVVKGDLLGWSVGARVTICSSVQQMGSGPTFSKSP